MKWNMEYDLLQIGIGLKKLLLKFQIILLPLTNHFCRNTNINTPSFGAFQIGW
jgi:hypothetical protein